ncbi:protein SCO1/2 [Thermoflavifilum aggregans]|uniref:Protein SCO1/2 n=1 Tax=Thermoflavifilum aggregans TaxID=454188 RepID=A0A2M9CXZ6_9BACT|nr:SCO family protein [Thermoflavifilum aggregans]PJJ76770.1 protein SCO1/2 [Thermoflavifilum aggregans]
MQRRNQKMILGLVLIILLPLIGFWAMVHFSKRDLNMPGYYFDRVDSTRTPQGWVYDTMYYRLNEIHFINQLRHVVTLRDLQGKVVLISFYCFSCQDDSGYHWLKPMKMVQDAFHKNDSALLMLTISYNPRDDRVDIMKAVANQLQIDEDSWWFLTTDSAHVDQLNQMLFDMGINLPLEQLSDTTSWVLLDKHQYVRGFYDPADSSQLPICMNDIALLMLEKEKKK